MQTSAAYVVTAGLGNDAPRIGDSGYGRGIVIEQSRTNTLLRSNEFGDATWNKNTGVTCASATTDVTAPDGTSTASKIVYTTGSGAGSYRVYQTIASATDWVQEVWLRTASGTASIRLGTNAYATSNLTITSAWQRFVVSGTAANTQWHIYAADGSDDPFTIYAWCAQKESGKFPSESIPTTSASVTRSTERLYLSTDSAIIDQGRVSLEMAFVAKGARGEYDSGGAQLFSSTNLAAYFHPSNGRVSIAYTTPAGGPFLSFARGDRVEIWMEHGGGTLATVVKARVNGGSVVTLSDGTHTGGSVAATGNPVDICCYSTLDGSKLACWLQRVRAYAYNKRPPWAA